MSFKPSQSIGAANAQKLDSWVSATPLANVPRNHTGASSKQAICRLLAISKSTIGTNSEIREIFEKLDCKLLSSHDNRKCALQETVTNGLPPDALIRLLDEIDSMQAEVARLSYLSDNAQWIAGK